MQHEIKRRPKLIGLLLAILSLALPGFGQVFSAQFLRGLYFLVLVGFMFAISAMTNLICFATSAIIWAFSLVILYLYIAYDAYRLNVNSGVMKLKWYNRWYFYIAIGIVFYILQASVFYSWGYKQFLIANNSNYPTLQLGDRVMAKMNYGKSQDFFVIHSIPAIIFSKPQYTIGSLVFFTIPERFGDNMFFVKRIVAASGDTFAIKNGLTLLNGEPISEAYVLPSNDTSYSSKNFGPVIVPNGYVLVLNDNRDVVADSREFGYIAVNHIEGKALYILWSNKLRRIGLRLDS